MDIFFSRTLHISEQIFAQMDKANLTKCREVAKSWQNCIDRKNLPWIQITIPKIHWTLRNLEKNTYMHIAARYGQSKIFNEIFKSLEFKNPKNSYGQTPVHFICIYGHVKILKQSIAELNVNEEWRGITPLSMACKHGQLNIAKILVEKSTELNIDLNAKDRLGCTAFHIACMQNQFKIVELFIQKSTEFNIKLDTRNKSAKTPFISSCFHGNFEVAKIIMQNSANFTIDFNAKDRMGRTAFHWACCCNRKDIVEMMINNEISCKLDFKVKDDKDKTGFQIAHNLGNLRVIKLLKRKHE